MPDTFRLSDMSFDEVSLCPEGDNGPAKVVLAKTAPKTGTKSGGGKHHKDGWQNRPHKFKGDGNGSCELCEGDEDGKVHVKKTVKEWLMEVIKHAPDEHEVVLEDEPKEGAEDGDPDKSREASDSEDTLTEDDPTGEEDVGNNADDSNIDKTGLSDEVQGILKAKEDEIADLKAQLAAQDDDDDSTDDVTKVLAKADPAVRTLIEKMQADTKEAQEIAKAEREQRLEREFLAKAVTMPHVEGTPEEKATILRKAYDVSAEYGATVEKALRAANEQVAKSDLFKSVGLGGGDTTIAKSVEAKAAELRKEDPKLTQEQAIAQVYDNDPSLYDEQMKEGA